MATYTNNGLAGAPTTYWFTRDINPASAATFISASASMIVYANSDGSQTRIFSATSDFTFTNVGGIITLTGGTITSAQRTNGDGSAVYETITGGTGYAATLFQSHLGDSDLQGIASEIFSGSDTFNGASGNDFFKAFAGNDTINGGAGFDTVSYSHGSMTGPVTITVGTTNTVGAATTSAGSATALSGTIGTDTFDSVEQFNGTNQADTFTAFRNFAGSGGTFNQFEGFGGNDTITGNLNTRLSYGSSFSGAAGSGAGVTFTWTNGGTNGGGTATGTGIGTDTFTGVNAIQGSQLNDTFSAAGASLSSNVSTFFNSFIFIGGGGNDTITGGGAFNAYNGGVQARWDANLARYDFDAPVTITVGTTNTFGAATTDIATVVGTTAGTDTLHFVEGFRGTSSADTYTAYNDFRGLFNAFNQFEGMGGNDVIVGNGLTRINYSTATAGVTVTWTASVGSVFTGAGTAVGDATVGTDFFYGVNSARGGAGNDVFTATGAHGNFSFNNSAGNDTVNGGTFATNNASNVDFDTANYQGATSGVTFALGATTTVTGDGSVGTDTLVQVERFQGSHYNDTYTVGGGFAASYGALNVFDGGGGNDTVTGNGSTRLDYRSALAGVSVSLATGTGQSTAGGDAAQIGVDTFTGVNGLQGSHFNDVLTGSNGTQAEDFHGEEGNDIIDGGGGLRDLINYRDSAAGIVANLVTGQVQDGYGTTDTVSNVEDVSGSEFNDDITGNGGDNYLAGQDGSDTIHAGNGNDTLVGDDDNINFYNGVFGISTASDSGNDFLYGEGGNDTLYGGLGNDLLDGGTGNDQMSGGAGNDTYVVDSTLDTITEAGGVDTVQTSLAFYALDAGNLLENLTFTNASTFNIGVGNQLANVLTGTTGGDSLTGGGGADTFNAGDGNDYLYIDSVDTSINAGAGYDAIFIQDNASFTLNVGAAQAEWVYGWVGNNVLNASTAAAGVTMVGEAGADQLIGSAFNDYLYIDSLDTVIDAGGGANDALFVYVGSGQVATDTTINVATANAEWVLGGDGNDTIFNTGDSSSVTLSGGGGNDTLTGGLANDYLFGNAGNDIFVVTANAQFDAVIDFQDGLDRVNVHNLGTAFDTFAEIQAVASSNGAGSTILNFGGGNTMLLYNFNIANLTVGDFIF